MKFKTFDYNSRAISDASKLMEDLQDFILDLDVTPHAEEFISKDDYEILSSAVMVLEAFHRNYGKAAYRAALDRYTK